MQIVLSGALPEPHQARELLIHVEQKAPTLTRWLDQSDCQIHQIVTAEARCTALEAWQLHHAGFTAQPAQHLSAGLGPLLEKNPNHSDTATQQATWLAELVHIAPSRDGAALIPASALDITEAESAELLASSQQWFTDTVFNVALDSASHWQIEVPDSFVAGPASPTLVSYSAVNDWWEQDLATRPWRRLINELQMFWFNHPVNQAREQAHKLPINSLWLVGGASRDQFTNLSGQRNYELYTDLAEAAARHDWGTWLEQLAGLERNLFAPLAKGNTPQLVLCGTDRYIQTQTANPSLLQRLFNRTKSDWRKAWSPL